MYIILDYLSMENQSKKRKSNVSSGNGVKKMKSLDDWFSKASVKINSSELQDNSLSVSSTASALESSQSAFLPNDSSSNSTFGDKKYVYQSPRYILDFLEFDYLSKLR